MDLKLARPGSSSLSWKPSSCEPGGTARGFAAIDVDCPTRPGRLARTFGIDVAMGNVNRKMTKRERANAHQVIREAFPQYEPVFGAHGDFGGHRAPRDHTIAFRLRDNSGKYHSNVVWLFPEELAHLTVDTVRDMVAKANGANSKRRK